MTKEEFLALTNNSEIYTISSNGYVKTCQYVGDVTIEGMPKYLHKAFFCKGLNRLFSIDIDDDNKEFFIDLKEAYKAAILRAEHAIEQAQKCLQYLKNMEQANDDRT